MPDTLLIRLEGPLQAWGAEGAALTRPTRTEPTFSGVVGLLANALGRRRDEDVSDLAGLRFGVRCDRPGNVIRDYHTAGAGPYPRTSPRFPAGVVQADGKIPTDPDRRLVPTERYLLSDAAFICGLEGDPQLLATLDAALTAPARPLFLGRKANPPSAPIRVTDGLRAGVGVIDALAGQALITAPHAPPPPRVRVLVTAARGEHWDHVVRDTPIGTAFATRRFQPRRVRTLYLETTPGPPYPVIDPDDPLTVWVPGDIVA